MQDGSFFGNYPHKEDYPEFYALVQKEVAFNARRLSHHPSLALYSGNNEGSVFGNLPLYVDTQLATVQRENKNVIVYPSCPSAGWASVKP